MNLYDLVTNCLSRTAGKRNNSNDFNLSENELNYLSNREYEDTLLMLFMAAKHSGYCGLNCYYSKGSQDIDTVRIYRLNFTKKIESLQQEIQKKQTELDNLSREEVAKEVERTAKVLLSELPKHIHNSNAILARIKILDTFLKDIKENDEYKILLIKSLAYQVAQLAPVESCADADAAQIAIMYLFSTVREALQNRLRSEECSIEYTESYVKGISKSVPELANSPLGLGNAGLGNAGLEILEEKVQESLESRERFLKNMISCYETELAQLRRRQLTSDTILDLLTTVFYVPSNWTIETVDDVF